MSRIIVKQLPKNITEEKLRNLFGTRGTITDMQLKYTPDGKFRQFCFIGYRSEEEAQEAIKYFNNTCIQTSRIKIEVCAALGSDDKPQARSKAARKAEMESAQKEIQKEKQEKNNNKTKVSNLDEIIGKHKDDPDFQEFMKAHDKKRTLWANDAGENLLPNEDIGNTAEKQSDTERIADKNADVEDDVGSEDQSDEKLAEKPISDLDYMKNLIAKSTTTDSKRGKTKASLDLFTIKVHNVPYKTKRQEILKFFKPLKPYSVRLPTNVHGFCYVGFKTEKDMTKAMLKNKSFIKGKQVFFSDFTEKNKITKLKGERGEKTTDHKIEPSNSKWTQQEQSLQNEEGIAESGRIFFRNLAYTVTEDDLQHLFEKFGPIAEINVPVDTVTRQIKGFGTVTFVMPEHAVQAFNKLDGTDFHGRLLHLIPGKSRDEDKKNEEDISGLSFKQKKALKLKKSAQQSVNWNTLFLGPNAVAEILAKRFDTTKEKVLDTSEGGSSAAVRIALGETQIVIEMKNFLEENGVRLSAFDSPTVKRSKTVILAKNLPADTTVAELTPIFSKFGPLGRLILPPSGVTALIEFGEPSEAKQAFKKLAYSKFKNAPLYLEWAPEQTFTTTLSGETIIPKQEEQILSDESITTKMRNNEMETHENGDNNQPIGSIKEEEINNEDDLANEAPEPNTTLFLRNLNFKTIPEKIQNHFKHLGAIHTIEIAKRKDPKNPRNQVSMGYGFIQFKLSETAERALKEMQFTQIDGNQVELKRSDRTLKTSTHAPRKQLVNTQQTGTKILVRNIPFQAKEKEVREIFKAFGELRSVRLPKKMTPGADTHRGFGFVDFITKSDAKKAFEALSQSTHLYGRHLVLEWASTTDDDVEEIRKRAAADYLAGARDAKTSRKAVFNAAEQFTAADEEDE